MRAPPVALVTLLPAIVSCIGPALLTDGSSVSIGDHRSGLLRHGTRLPFRGRGFVVPERWRLRRRNYGTDELVSALMRAAYKVERGHRGAVVGFADLSPAGGGPTSEHGSHTSGRDADVIFYATNLEGRPVIPQAMVAYDAAGLALPAALGPMPASEAAPDDRAGPPPTPASDHDLAEQPRPPPQRFDVRRNWSFVRALLNDRAIAVQWIFINRDLARLLLDHARRTGESASLLERAASVMHQPSDAGLHDDHLHLRIYCPVNDRAFGCQDAGPSRWDEQALGFAGPPSPPMPPLLLERFTLLARRYPLL
ncbi:MAG: penicillin-insensitive murein endopeptidase [Proteobacteria bacterium]|nr:penicillin-insensitive murein endopeptidase [Pseudomonadota bacterium]